jgi:hypothetical protein
MRSISMLVTPVGTGGGRFVMQRDEVWQDGDLGLKEDGMKAAQRLFDTFTSFARAEKSFSYIWLRSQCRELYRQLVPEATHKILQDAFQGLPADAHPTLHIYSYPVFDNVPWELLHDGVDHLGLRFQLSRMPIVSSPPAPATQARSIAKIYHVLGRGVVDLPTDQQLFTDWLDTFGKIPTNSFPSSTAAPVWPTLDTIEEACTADVLHLTCHGQTAGAGWSLDQNGGAPSVIDATFIDDVRLSEGKPLVFANACSSTGGGASLQYGLAHKFIARGTLNLVGTFAPVTRTVAIQFGRTFYERLFTPVNGEPPAIGEVLRRTKEEFHRSATQPPAAAYDPSYLFYCLYGPGKSQFAVAAQVQFPAQEGGKP